MSEPRRWVDFSGHNLVGGVVWSNIGLMVNRATSSIDPSTYAVYAAEARVRPAIAPLADVDAATALFSQALRARGVAQADQAYVQLERQRSSSALGWDRGTVPMTPFAAIAPGMLDPITVLHEAAHAVTDSPFAAKTKAEAHRAEFVAVFVGLLREHAPDVSQGFETAHARLSASLELAAQMPAHSTARTTVLLLTESGLDPRVAVAEQGAMQIDFGTPLTEFSGSLFYPGKGGRIENGFVIEAASHGDERVTGYATSADVTAVVRDIAAQAGVTKSTIALPLAERDQALAL